MTDQTPVEAATGGAADASDPGPTAADRRPAEARKSVLLRLHPAVYQALSRWAADDFRSVNGEIEWLLRQALQRAGRLPSNVPSPRRPGRPSKGSQPSSQG
ncbi:MAG: hypothetical protein LBL92_05890 [Propionibacteriaceae bacterium]|jgi:hypothetical protein|nr:hypothetical protein [Propionibacteriaceae bacterium]